MNKDYNAPPLNPLPWIVWALALPLIAVELVLSLADRGLIGGAQGAGWRLQLVQYHLGLYPDLLRAQWEAGGHPYAEFVRLIGYPLVHISFSQAIFAVVLLLALGKMVGEIFHWWAVVAVVLGATILGGIAYTVLVPGNRVPLIGAYPAVYGLIGAFTFLLWVNLARTGANKYRAFSLIGALLLFQLIFGVLFGAGWDWVADVSGFVSGFLLSFLVSPGGWARVMDKLRQR